MLAAVLKVAAGTFHSVLVREDGSVWGTGLNSLGQIGLGEATYESKIFVPVIESGVIATAIGTDHTMVLKQDGIVWVTGENSNGQLGDGTIAGRSTFSPIRTFPGGVHAVAAGSYHSIVLTKEGRVWTTGWNKRGQLGDGSYNDRTSFFKLVPFGVMAIAAGDVHTILLKSDGSLFAAGRNYNGQLGDGSRNDRKSFVKVISSGVAEVSTGGYHTLVLKQDDSVWATGWNAYGQLGDGTTTDSTKYREVVSGHQECKPKAIAAGRRHSLMLKEDGSIWATGYNRYGQLGNRCTSNSIMFVMVMSHGAKGVAAGAFHSMAISNDNSVWYAGSNKYGQSGDREIVSMDVFTEIRQFTKGSGHYSVPHVHLHDPVSASPCEIVFRIMCLTSYLPTCLFVHICLLLYYLLSCKGTG